MKLSKPFVRLSRMPALQTRCNCNKLIRYKLKTELFTHILSTRFSEYFTWTAPPCNEHQQQLTHSCTAQGFPIASSTIITRRHRSAASSQAYAETPLILSRQRITHSVLETNPHPLFAAVHHTPFHSRMMRLTESAPSSATRTV